MYKWFYCLIILMTIVVMSACDYRPRVDRSVEVLEMDTVEQQETPTVMEVLQWREEMRLDKYVDSVFLVIPTQILTHILVNKGVDLSNHEIVSTYISNKDFYDSLIKKSMDIQKEYFPDSIPKSFLPQPNSDTIKQLHSFKVN